MGFKTKISKIHYDKNVEGLFFNFLKFASLFYVLGSGLKNKLYDNGIVKPFKVDADVISVGNLTTGGVGKTPIVAEIAKHFIEKGERVSIITRGYGSKLSSSNISVVSDGETVFYDSKMAGDEPVWLAETLKGASVIISKNRIGASKYAIDKFKATKIILDDGFQHRKLHRDLNIVVIDSEMGFGNENLLPAGPLREGLEAFNRIDRLVVVSKNSDHTRAEKYAKIMGKKLKKQTLVCYTEPDFIYNILNIEEKLSDNEKVLAFSAIGQPQQFYKFLKNAPKTVDFDDHHSYSQADADKLVQICIENGLKSLVTTEKDAVKVKGLDFRDIKVYALKLKTKIDVEALLDEKIG